MTKPTDFEFDIEPDYDERIANEGVWFHCILHGKDRGKFKLRHFNKFTVQGERDLKRLKAANRALFSATHDDAQTELDILQMVELNLIDWSGITAKGKEVPFSKEAAYAYFRRLDTRVVLMHCLMYAGNPMNYESDEAYAAREAEAAAKN